MLLNYIIVIYLLVAFLLQASLVYGNSEVGSLHVHASSYANGTPDNYSYETSIFQLCESYNLATGVCEGDIYNVETDTGEPVICDIAAGMTFNYIRFVTKNEVSMKASATYTEAQKDSGLGGIYYPITSNSCATDSSVTNTDGVVGVGAVNGTASLQLMTGHTVPGNETDQPSAVGQRFSGSETNKQLKFSNMVGTAFESVITIAANRTVAVGDLGSLVWAGNADSEKIDWILPLTSSYTTKPNQQPFLSIVVNLADTVWAQTLSIHAGSFEIVPESCLIWAAGITFDVTLSD